MSKHKWANFPINFYYDNEIARINEYSEFCKKSKFLTGYSELDELIHGFQPGNLYVVVAPKHFTGKTAFLLNTIVHLANNSNKTLFVCPAMSASRVAQRLMSLISRIKIEKISTGNLDMNEVNILKDFTKNHNQINSHLYVIDSPLITVKYLRKLLYSLPEKERPSILVIDDVIELAVNDKRRPVKKITKMMLQLMELAQNFEMPILISTNLSSESNLFQLRDLKKKGIAEQYATAIIFLSRSQLHFTEHKKPKVLMGDFFLRVAKNQYGKLGTIKLKDQLDIQSIRDCTDEKI
jgi:replicative DNA helicase